MARAIQGCSGSVVRYCDRHSGPRVQSPIISNVLMMNLLNQNPHVGNSSSTGLMHINCLFSFRVIVCSIRLDYIILVSRTCKNEMI